MTKTYARWALAAAIAVSAAAVTAGRVFGQQQQPTSGGGGTGHGPAVNVPAKDSGAGAMLAVRFGDVAEGVWHNAGASGAELAGARYARALYDVAAKLDPKEPVYLRRGGMIAAVAGDVEGALHDLVAYARVDAADRVVFSKIMELYAARMETADEKIKYLKQMAAEAKVPEEVRSDAAVLCAKVLLDRGDRDAGIAMLGQAVRYNPLNGEALRMRYDLVGRGGTAYERGVSLLAMVRANPASPQLVAAMAEELAEIGVADQAVNWYGLALGLYQRAGVAPDMGFVTGYAAQLYRQDQLDGADQLLSQVVDTGDPEVLFLKLLVDKTAANKTDAPGGGGAGGGAAGTYQKTREKVRNLLTARLAYLARAAGDEKATTRPTTTGAYVLPDVVALADRVVKSGDVALVRQYAAATGDLAWFLIYFENKPAEAATLMAGLKKIAGPGAETDPVIVRLEGWSYLVANKPDEAKVKLSAVADRDPLAAMGVVKLAPADDRNAQREAEQTARRLVSEHTTGALGATLWEALRSEHVKPVVGKAGDALVEELKKFPIGVLAVGTRPDGFYVLRVEPVLVSYAYGEPMTAKVTLQNLSDLDLTIGADGVINPGLWVEPSLRGNQQQGLPPAWVDPGWGQWVLRGRQSVTRWVRLDRGALGDVLAAAPGQNFIISGTAVSNGFLTERGVVPGVAGYRVQFTRFTERQALPVYDAAGREKVMATAGGSGDAAGASGGERMRALEGIAQDIVAARRAAAVATSEPAGGGAVVADAETEGLAKGVESSRTADDPAVRAWATFLSGLLAPDAAGRGARVDALAGDAAWQARAMAVVAAGNIGPDKVADLARRLAADPEPVVKELARAAADWAVPIDEGVPATTQPSGR